MSWSSDRTVSTMETAGFVTSQTQVRKILASVTSRKFASKDFAYFFPKLNFGILDRQIGIHFTTRVSPSLQVHLIRKFRLTMVKGSLTALVIASIVFIDTSFPFSVQAFSLPNRYDQWHADFLTLQPQTGHDTLTSFFTAFGRRQHLSVSTVSPLLNGILTSHSPLTRTVMLELGNVFKNKIVRAMSQLFQQLENQMRSSSRCVHRHDQSNRESAEKARSLIC